MSREAVALLLIKEVVRFFGVDLTGFFPLFVRNIDVMSAMNEISSKLDASAALRVKLQSVLSVKIGAVSSHSDIRASLPIEMQGLFDQAGSAEIWRLYSIKQARRGKAHVCVYYNLSLTRLIRD